MRLVLFVAFALFSIALADEFDPPTFYYELNATPLTTNEVVSSNIILASGVHTLHLTEAPGTQADVYVDWYLDDKSTVFRSSDFLNQSSTADVNTRMPVLSNWAKVYVRPAATQTTSLVVYGSWGAEH